MVSICTDSTSRGMVSNWAAGTIQVHVLNLMVVLMMIVPAWASNQVRLLCHWCEHGLALVLLLEHWIGV